MEILCPGAFSKRGVPYLLKYIIKRLIFVPIMVVATTFVIFALINMTKDDPALQMLPTNYTQEQLEEKHAELGLDKPFLIRYVNWLVNAVQGDFGISYSQKIPVSDAIAGKVGVSIRLALYATLAIIILGIPIGVLCAVKQYRAFDSIMNVVAKFLSAFPEFWMAIMLMLLFAVKLQWFPIFGMKAGVKSWVLPIIALVLPNLGGYVRQARSSMLDCIRQDYVRTARSKGARESQVIFKDALRPALLPIVTSTGMRFASLLGGATVVESCFAFPGLGSLLIDAIAVKDINLTMAGCAILAFAYILMMLVVDLAYAVIDPRIKSTFLKGSAKKKKKPEKKAEEVA